MKIYVVKRGDSVWSIAKRFGVTPQKIINANALYDSPNLVVGQSLIIPSKDQIYKMLPGDTLWSISQEFGVSVDSIVDSNNITTPYQIYPGAVITIPEKSKNYGYIQVNGFIQPSTAEKEKKVLNESSRYLTYLSPFSYHINADGSLTPIDDSTMLKVENKVAPLLSITNISGANFDTKLINNVLNNEELKNTIINNILSTIQDKGYYGVIVDFERISPENKEKYNDFLRKLTAKLHPNYLVGTALAPKTYDVQSGAWHGGHDYKSHGEIVDFVVIMTYEWGWSGGPPMAVAPINEVKKVINYAVSVIPSKKIMMGIPLYGYDWTLPYMPGGEFAEAIGNQEAIDRAAKYGAIIKYDEKAQSPYYNYVDRNGNEHIVWFEDARSVEAKYKLTNNYNLRGVSYWALGKPFPQNFEVLDNMFKIEKIVT